MGFGKDYVALIIAKVYDESENETFTVRTMCFADSFTSAARQVEEYFGNELEGLSIELLDCIPHMTEDMFNQIRERSL